MSTFSSQKDAKCEHGLNWEFRGKKSEFRDVTSELQESQNSIYIMQFWKQLKVYDSLINRKFKRTAFISNV